MAKNISRRHMFSLTAATVGGVTALAGGAHARTTEQSRALSTGGWSADPPSMNRPYWEQPTAAAR